MRAQYTYIFILIILGNTMRADTFSPQVFVDSIFSQAKKDVLAVKDANAFNRLSKKYEIWGSALVKIFNKAIASNEDEREKLLQSTKNALQKLFQITFGNNQDSIVKAQTIIDDSFKKFSATPAGYYLAFPDVFRTFTNYNDKETRGYIIDALITYMKWILEAENEAKSLFNQDLTPSNATKKYYDKVLKNKESFVKAGIGINALIDKLIQKTRTSIDLSSMTPEQQKKIIDETITKMTGSNIDELRNSLVTILNTIQTYTPAQRYIILTTIRNLLLHFFTPPDLPVAEKYTPRPNKGSWLEQAVEKTSTGFMSALDTIGGGLNTVGGGLKVAFVDNVYEKGLKKLGELFDDYLIKKPRNLAHQIADVANGIATQLSNVPNEARAGAIDIIGGFQKICKEDKPDPADSTKKICIKEGTELVPTLEQNLRAGAKKLGESIAKIRASVQEAQKQKQDVIALKLQEKRLIQFKQLNELLMDAFPALEDALSSLASADCSSGVLCDIQKELLRAADQAKIDIEDIENNIRSTDRKINHPTLLEDGVVESLPNRLHNIATTLSF